MDMIPGLEISEETMRKNKEMALELQGESVEDAIRKMQESGVFDNIDNAGLCELAKYERVQQDIVDTVICILKSKHNIDNDIEASKHWEDFKNEVLLKI